MHQLEIFTSCSPVNGFPAVDLPSSNCPLTMLSLGGGQDSVTLLNLYINDASFRAKYAPGRFLVVMSDTGNEHDQTYEYVDHITKLCEKNGIEFHFLTSDMGFHSKAWETLTTQYRRNNTCGSRAFAKSCTHNLKIVPIYKFLESWLGYNYGVRVHNKHGIKAFESKYGKINVIIGIAAGEESRVNIPDENPESEKWKLCLNMIYPLIDLGFDRQSCQDYLRNINQPIPYPSNCKMCPWLSFQELLWLYRFCPHDYIEWVKIEGNKICKWHEQQRAKGKPNHGVFGAKLLPEALSVAQARYGHWSDEQLDEYKMSHGHCVKSKY